MSHFELDQRLQSSCFEVAHWPLSQVLLKNNADYSWIILVPRREHVTELTQLSQLDRHQLMDEIQQTAEIMKELLLPDKINIASLGNVVSQLHVHVVARFITDPLWPQGIWQMALEERPYNTLPPKINNLIERLSTRYSAVTF